LLAMSVPPRRRPAPDIDERLLQDSLLDHVRVQGPTSRCH
jgi:hypothetical protein